jgi:hypothetical protein
MVYTTDGFRKWIARKITCRILMKIELILLRIKYLRYADYQTSGVSTNFFERIFLIFKPKTPPQADLRLFNGLPPVAMPPVAMPSLCD